MSVAEVYCKIGAPALCPAWYSSYCIITGGASTGLKPSATAAALRCTSAIYLANYSGSVGTLGSLMTMTCCCGCNS